MATVCKKCVGCRGVLKRRGDLLGHVVGRKDGEGITGKPVKKKKWSWDTWVVQSVECPTLAQVMILQFVS